MKERAQAVSVGDLAVVQRTPSEHRRAFALDRDRTRESSRDLVKLRVEFEQRSSHQEHSNQEDADLGSLVAMMDAWGRVLPRDQEAERRYIEILRALGRDVSDDFTPPQWVVGLGDDVGVFTFPRPFQPVVFDEETQSWVPTGVVGRR